tara:strand:- start:24 stop:155 length:132 start_codon:yes stop_codon:yes gene_type:complete
MVFGSNANLIVGNVVINRAVLSFWPHMMQKGLQGISTWMFRIG